MEHLLPKKQQNESDEKWELTLTLSVRLIKQDMIVVNRREHAILKKIVITYTATSNCCLVRLKPSVARTSGFLHRVQIPRFSSKFEMQSKFFLNPNSMYTTTGTLEWLQFKKTNSNKF
jgi:hypothetical protein